jgi:cell volume regulation protein A
MQASDDIILVGGVLCLCAILAGLASARIGTPLLLVFIGVGVLAGEDGPGGILYDNFELSYFIGSVALVAILFQGGLTTSRAMLRQGLWPAIALSTVGVAISAALVAGAAVYLFGVTWLEGLLLGAVTAPTDAAAVNVVLRRTKLALPPRVEAILEVESGLNDPMSVFLTLLCVEFLQKPGPLAVNFAVAAHTVGVLLWEMAGGAMIGLLGGGLAVVLFRKLAVDLEIYPTFAAGAAMVVFGGAQSVGASGFLAVYLAGLIIGNTEHQASQPVERFFGALGWLAQITLFLMLGLLVTPHELPPVTLPALAIAAVLILLGRPVGVALCLLPLRWAPREVAFVSWVGLRGAVPIYLTVIPLLAGLPSGRILFNVVFVVVIASVAVQGWTIPPIARLLKLSDQQK